MTKDYHKKPTKKERSVQNAIDHAAIVADRLPKIIQVKASDWDLVILADEVARLQEYEWKYKDLCK
jgi:hypothetical protein